MILELDSIELFFSKKRILNGIYLKTETGKVTGILGRNGCGKSSLLHIVFGDLEPEYKMLRLDGKPILKPFYQTNLVCFFTTTFLSAKCNKNKDTFQTFESGLARIYWHF